MRDEFFAFLESPEDCDVFLRVRAVVIASDDYDPYSRDLDDALDLIDREEFAQADQRLRDAMPNLLLSPRAHMLASIVAGKLGEVKTSDAERYIALACLQGILSTGDGTSAKPYTVLRTSDEYDVLQYLEKQLARQSLHERKGRHLDCLQTTDGEKIWFDIQDAYQRMSDSLSRRNLDEPADGDNGA